MTSLQLFVPALASAPVPPADATSRLPCLHRLLARARPERQHCDSLDQALCERFGVARQRDWPIAPLTLLADGHDPGAAYWLRADPVHLHATRGELVLAGACDPGLTQADADALVAALNRHFAADALRFAAPHPHRWYVCTEQPAALTTIPLRDALGRSIDALLPSGEDALLWHRRLNEVQMLLHEHPVNAAREARGAGPVNSVWLWGGGRRPDCNAGHGFTAWSEAALVRGLARCAGVPCQDVPAGGAAWLQAAHGDQHVLVLDQKMHVAVAQPEEKSHARWLDDLEHDWLVPLTRAVREGVLEQIALITQHGDDLLRFSLARRDLWKFWRRARPFAQPPAPAGARLHA